MEIPKFTGQAKAACAACWNPKCRWNPSWIGVACMSPMPAGLAALLAV